MFRVGKKERESVYVEKRRQYVVYDRAAEKSGPLFEAENDVVAGRCFRGLLQQTHDVNADDYDLYYVGTYNPAEMVFESALPVRIVVAMPQQMSLINPLPESAKREASE